MYCKNCGNKIEEPTAKFCNNCGTKIDEIKIIKNVDKKKENDQLFLIIGIILAFCCSMPFGIAIILLNEMKYKPQIKEGNYEAANKTKKIMITLVCIGFVFGILISGLSFFVELVSNLE